MSLGRRSRGHRVSSTLTHTDAPVVPPYYIDSVAGNDANSGQDTAHPWKTLDPINALGSSLPPDTVVSLKRGSTFTGPLLCASSGTSGHPIVYQDYSTGALPIIQDAANGTQSESNPNTQIKITGSWVTVKNIKVQSTPDHTIDGTFSITNITRSGSTVTVTTSTAHTAVAAQAVTITGTTAYNGSHTIATVPTSTTFTFSQASGGTESTGKVTGGSWPGPWPAPVNISFNQGVAVNGTAANVVIDGIEATSLWAGICVSSDGLTTIQNCNLHDCNHMGKNTIKTNDDSGCFGINLKADNNVITKNTIANNHAYSFDFGVDGSAIEIFGSSHNTITYNTMSDCAAMCESAKTGGGRAADDHEVAYNVYYLSAALTKPDGTQHTSAGWTSKGFGSSIGPVLNTRLYNNLFYMPYTANGVIYNGSGDVMGDPTTNPSASLVLKMVNNIVWAGRDANGQIGGKAVSLGGGSASTNGLVERNNDIYGNHTMFGSSTTVDATDKTANPSLKNPTSDFTLNVGSPCINAGSTDSITAGYTTDLAGNPVGSPPDIGPYAN